jgi:hypothetical protein
MKRTRKAPTQDELDLLQREYPTHTIPEMAAMLGRTEDSIKGFLKRRVPRQIKKKWWSKQELHKLMDLAEKYGHTEISKRLNRSIGSVNVKMRALGIHSYHGSFSLNGAERATGYHPDQFKRAKAALHQTWHWRRSGWQGRFVISGDQLDELCEWLKWEGNPDSPFKRVAA